MDTTIAPPRPPKPYVYTLDGILDGNSPIPEEHLFAIIFDYESSDYVEDGSVICTGAFEMGENWPDRQRYGHTHLVSLAYTAKGEQPGKLRDDGTLTGPGALYGLNVATGEFALYAD